MQSLEMSNNGLSISNHGSLNHGNLNGFTGNGTIMTTAQAREGLAKHSSSPVNHQGVTISQTNQIRVQGQQQGQQQNPQKIFIQVTFH